MRTTGNVKQVCEGLGLIPSIEYRLSKKEKDYNKNRFPNRDKLR